MCHHDVNIINERETNIHRLEIQLINIYGIVCTYLPLQIFDLRTSCANIIEHKHVLRINSFIQV